MARKSLPVHVERNVGDFMPPLGSRRQRIKMKQFKGWALGALIILGASAQAIQFDLGVVYTGATPGGTPPYITVKIVDVGTNKVNLRVDHNSGSSAGQFVSNVYLNLSPFFSSFAISNEINANKRNGAFSLSNNGVNGGAGNTWDMGIGFVTSNSSGGVNRLRPGEFWSADLTATGLSAAAFNAINNQNRYAGAHVQGINGNNSGHVASMTPVPEPATISALALGVLAMIRKRRKGS